MRGWIRKINEFLFFGKNGFFRTLEDGRQIYYPWGRPGESFYISECQGKQLIALHYCLAALVLISFFASDYFFSEGGVETLLRQILWTAINLIFLWLSVIYISAMYILRAYAELSDFVDGTKTNKKMILLWILFVVSSYLVWLPTSSDAFLNLPILKIATLFATVLTPIILYVLIKIWARRGYYFSNLNS